MEANNQEYSKARYDFDTYPQIYGFQVGKIYPFRDFGGGIEVFYDNGSSLAMGYDLFNYCFTKVYDNKRTRKILSI